MIVEWRAKAREDRNNIFDYIAEDNPTAALELDDRIEQQTDAGALPAPAAVPAPLHQPFHSAALMSGGQAGG